MSRKHWIDEFFRKRLERETFAMEKGELEDVHALLVKRNGTGALKRGWRANKWWLSALIPAAGVLWWAMGGQDQRAELSVTRIAEQQLTANEYDALQQVPSATRIDNGSAVQPVDGPVLADAKRTEMNAPPARNGHSAELPALVDPSIGGDGIDALMTDMTRTSSTEGMAAADKGRTRDPVVGSQVSSRGGRNEARAGQPKGRQGFAERSGIARTVGAGSGSPQEGTSDGLDRQDRSAQGLASDEGLSLFANDGLAVVDDGTTRTSPLDEEVHQTGLKRYGTDLPDTQPDPLDEGRLAQDATRTDEAQRLDADVAKASVVPSEQANSVGKSVQVEAPERAAEVLASAREQRETIEFMAPRRSMPTALEAPMPVSSEVPEFKLFATGELHGFGAPLAVRARNGGQRSEVQHGSLLGVEYRVRTKRFSWATGIYYGRYAIRADEGQTDLALAFVEIPVLASLKVGRGRFGLLAQGGISLDLLFNSNGRYPVTIDRTSAGFPEEVFSAANISWLLRPQALYQIDERLSVCVGPLWKAQLGRVASDGPLNGAHIASTGVSVGLTWRLERTTY
jgi:hypothetical protein